jgi:hypothetical protein
MTSFDVKKGPYLWWTDVKRPFWQEESIWPCIHFTTPLVVYFLTWDYKLTIIAMYMWEVLEQVLGRLSVDFKEANWDDSWIGDPLIGGCSAGALALADHTYGWTSANDPSVGIKILMFAAVTLAIAPLLFLKTPRNKTGLWKPELIPTGVAIIGTLLLGCTKLAVEGDTPYRLIVCTTAIGVAFALAIFPTPTQHMAVYKRMFLLATTGILAMLSRELHLKIV